VALPFVTTVAAQQMLFDVRTDTLLLGCTTWALWGSWRYVQRPTLARALVLGALIGLAMLAKGPVVLMVCSIAAFSELLARALGGSPQAFRPLVRPAWLAALPT